MDMHINNRQSTAVLNDIIQPIDEYGKNVTHSNNTRVFQPKLIVSEQSKKQYGSMYVNALREALFTHFEKPYKAPEVPLSIIQEGDNVSKHICRQCKDCFHHQTSLEEHTFRGSWILGYWCTDCFQECEHLSGKKLYCAKCIKLQIQKFKALQTRGLKKRNDPGIVKIFFNPCQLLEHMQMHNSEDIAINQLMLLPFPSGIGKEYFPHLKMISEALMDFMFLSNIHIADWLVQNKIHKWWRMAKGDNPVANIIKRYPFEVQQIKQLLSCNNKGNQASKSNLNIGNVSAYENKKNNAKNTENLLDKNKHCSSLSFPNLRISNTSETDETNNIQSNNDIAFIDCGPCDNEQSYSSDKQLFESSNIVGDLSNLNNTATVGTDQTKMSTSKAKISVKKFAKVPPSPVRSNNANASPTAAQLCKTNATANHRVVTIRSTKPVNLSSIIKNFPQIADKVANKKIVFIHKNLPKDVNLANLNNLHNNEVQNVGFLSNNGSSKDQNIDNQKIIQAHKLQQSGLLQTKLESSSSGSKSKPVIKPVNQQNLKNHSKTKTKVIKKVYRPIRPKPIQKKQTVQQKPDIEVPSRTCVQTKENSELYLATLKSSTRRTLEQFFHENELTFLTIKRNEKSGKNFLSVAYNSESPTDDTFIYRNKFFSNISKMSRSKIYVRINHIKAMSRKFSEKIGFFNNEIVKGHQKLISILDNIAINADSSSQFVDDYFGPLVNLTSGDVCAVCHKLIKSEEYIVGFTNVVTDADYCLCYDFICYKCNTFQGNKERFQAHLRYHNIESPFICPECNVSFSSFQSLNVHIWTECFHPLITRFLSCNICEIGGFCSLESIINHFVVMHSVKMAACNLCCMVFEYKRFCISHMKKGHSESTSFNKPLLLTICQLDDKVIPIECYNLHMQNHKCVQESYFYNCNLCSGSGKLFITKELIKTHIYKCHYSELSSFIDAESLSEILLRNDIQQLVKGNLTTNKSDMNLTVNDESETMQNIQTLKTKGSIIESTHSASLQTVENVITNNMDSETTNDVTNSKLDHNDKSSDSKSYKQLKLNKEHCNNTDFDAVESNSSHIELITSINEGNRNTTETRNQENIIPDKSRHIEQNHHETLLDENSEMPLNSDLCVDSVSMETLEKTCVSLQNPELKDKPSHIEQNHHETLLDENSEMPVNSDLCVDSVSTETLEKTCVSLQNPELKDKPSHIEQNHHETLLDENSEMSLNSDLCIDNVSTETLEKTCVSLQTPKLKDKPNHIEQNHYETLLDESSEMSLNSDLCIDNVSTETLEKTCVSLQTPKLKDKPNHIEQNHYETLSDENSEMSLNSDICIDSVSMKTSENTCVSLQNPELKDKPNNIEQNHFETLSDENSEIPLNSDLCVDSVLMETSDKTCVSSQNSELNIATNNSQLAMEENVNSNDIIDENSERNHCEEISKTSDNIASLKENTSPLISEKLNPISKIILDSDFDNTKTINVCENVKEHNQCDSSASKKSSAISITENLSVHDIGESKQFEHTIKISNNVTSENESIDLDKNVVNSTEFDIHEKEKSVKIDSTNLKPNNEENSKDLLSEKDTERNYSLPSIEKDDTQNLSNSSKDNSDLSQNHQLKNDKSKEAYITTLHETSENNGLKEMSSVPLEKQNSCAAKNLQSEKVNTQKIIEYSTSDDASKIDDCHQISNDSISIMNDDARLVISQTHDYIAKHNYVEIENKSDNIEDTNSSSDIVDNKKYNNANTNSILQELTHESGSNKQIQKGIDNLKLTANVQSEVTEKEFMSSNSDSTLETQIIQENLMNLDKSMELEDDRIHIINQCKLILNEPAEFSEEIIADMNNSNSLTNKISTSQDIMHNDAQNTKKQALVYEAVEEQQVYENNHITGNEELTNEQIKSIVMVDDDTRINNETRKESFNNDKESHVKNPDKKFSKILPIENGNPLEQCINVEQELDIELSDEDHVHSLMKQRSSSDSDRSEETEETLENNALLVAGESMILDQCMSLDNNALTDKDKIVHTTVEKIPVSDIDVLQECEHFEEMNNSVKIEEINKLDQRNDKKDQMNQINEPSTIQENNLLEHCVKENQTNINNSPAKDLILHTSIEEMSVSVSDKNVEEYEHFEENSESVTIAERNELEQSFDKENRTSIKTSSDNEKLEHTLIEDISVLNKDIGEEYEHFEEITESVKILESYELEQPFDKVDQTDPKSSSDNEKLEDALIEKVSASGRNIVEECEHFEEIQESVTIEESDEIHECISAEIEADDKSTPDIEKVVHSFIEEIAASDRDISSEFENFEEINELTMIEERGKVDQCMDEEHANKKCLTENENIEHSLIAEMSVSEQNIIEECENFKEINEFVTTDVSYKLDQSFDEENQINKKSETDNEKTEYSFNEEFPTSISDITKECKNSENINESVTTEENDELDQAFDEEDQTNETNSADIGTIEHSLIEDMLEAGRVVNKEYDNVEEINESVTLEKRNESDQPSRVEHQTIETNLTLDEEIIQLAVEKNLVSGIKESHVNCITVNRNVDNNAVKLVIEQDSEKISLEDKITELKERPSNCIISQSNIDNEEISNLTVDSFENSNLLNVDQLAVKENHESITTDKDEAVLETTKQLNSKELVFPSSIKVNITTDKINIDILSAHFISNNLTSEKNKMVLKDLTLKTKISPCSNKESFEAQNIKNADTEDSESNETLIHNKQIDILDDSNVKDNRNDLVDNSFLFSNVSSSAEASPVVESNIVSEDSSSLDLAISGKQPIEKTNGFIDEMDDSSSKKVLPDIKEKKDISMTGEVIKCNEYELKNLSLTDDEKINLSKNSISLESQVENSVVNVKRLRSRSSNRLNNSNSEVIKTKRKCKIKATTQLDEAQNLTEKNSKKSKLETNVVDSVDSPARENKLVKTQKVEIRKTRSKSKRRKEEQLKNSDVYSDNKSISSDAEEAKVVRRSLKRNRSENILNTDQCDQKIKLKESLLMQMPTLRLIKTSTRSSPVDFSDLPVKAPKLRAVKKYKIGFDNSTNVSAKIYKFKCHLCGDAISTSWSVVSDHYNKKHAHNYELCIISPKLTRLSDEDIAINKRKNDKKRKSSEASLANLKKKKRLSPKKVNEKIWISSDRTSGLFVQLESVIDGEGHFKCKKCDERCIDMAELRQHISDNHRIAKKNLICLECGENFVVSPSLQMHLKAFHGIEDPVAYMNKYPAYAPDIDDFEADAKTTAANQCHVCMAVFKDKLSVDKHLRVHGMAFLSKKRREARNAEISKFKVEKFDKDHFNLSTTRASQESQRNKATSSSSSDKASSSISSR